MSAACVPDRLAGMALRRSRSGVARYGVVGRVIRNLICFLFGVVLASHAVFSWAHGVSTGYGLDGACYSTPQKALEGFQRGLPTIREGFVTTLNSSSVAGNVLSYSITTRDFAAGTAKTLNGNLTLSSCQSVTGYMSDNMAGLLFACLTAFFTSFFLRKAIRKFSRFAGGMSTDF